VRRRRKISRKRYYVGWLIIAFIPIVFAIAQIIGVIEAIRRGYHKEPAFWAGAIVFSVVGYYLHDIKMWLRKRPAILTILFASIFTSLYYLGRTGKFPLAIQFMGWGPLGVVTAGVRAFRDEIFPLMGLYGRKTERKRSRRAKTALRIAENGSDQPWPAGWIYRLRKPIQRTFIRGFNDDMSLLSRVIQALADGEKLIFYCPFNPPNAEPDIFEKTIEFVQRHNVPHKSFVQKHGRIKRFISGEDESISAVSVDCTESEVLEWVLNNYWLGDYCCWFLVHNGDFEKWTAKMRIILNPKTFPDGFRELILDSRCFMRDVENGEALEVITDKLSREEIQERVSHC